MLLLVSPEPKGESVSLPRCYKQILGSKDFFEIAAGTIECREHHLLTETGPAGTLVSCFCTHYAALALTFGSASSSEIAPLATYGSSCFHIWPIMRTRCRSIAARCDAQNSGRWLSPLRENSSVIHTWTTISISFSAW